MVRRRILVVDDDPDTTEALALALEMAGYVVFQAGDGSEALECLKAEPNIDLLVVDLDMPRMDGRTLVWHMRKDARFRAIPVIIASAYVAQDLREQVEMILMKPVKLDHLIASIARIVPKALAASSTA